MKIKPIFLFLLMFLLAMMLLPSPKVSSAELTRVGLNEEQQTTLLAKRLSNPGKDLSLRSCKTFDSYASFFFAFYDICLHTESSDVAKRPLSYVFPPFYQPTFKELIYMIARQTGTTCRYDPERDYWVFNPPAMELPYTLNIAPGWKEEDCGYFIKYYPEIAPVGMDIYFLGNYSTDTNEEELYDKLRKGWALAFARSFPKPIRIEDLKKDEIDGVVALYADTRIEHPDRKLTWRQWSFVKKGYAFIIVSAIDDKNEDILLPDLQSMIKSFKLKE